MIEIGPNLANLLAQGFLTAGVCVIIYLLFKHL